MALCSSCQNILPQSSTRCPVCGSTPGISADDFLASLELASPVDDLAPSVTAPNGRVFTPPPLPTSTDAGPDERATDLTAMPARRGSAMAPIAATPAPILVDDDVDGEEYIRTVRAISNRLDADIRVGRRSGHRFFVTAAPIAAAALVLLGTYGAYHLADLARPVRVTSAEDAAQPGTLAFGGEQSDAAHRSAEAIAPQVNELMSIDCNVPITANVVSLSPTRLVTNASAVRNDPRPVIRFADSTSRVGTVIGIDQKTDIAVIEIDPVAGIGSMQWGVADQIFQDPEVVVVERFGVAIQGTPAVVDDIEGVVGLVQSFGFGGAGFRPGSAVLNRDGFIIGMVDDTGRSAIGGTELSAGYGRVIARPSAPTETCPIADPAATDAETPGTETTDGGGSAGGD